MTPEQIEAVRVRAIVVRNAAITFGGVEQIDLAKTVADDLDALATRLAEVERERDEAREMHRVWVEEPEGLRWYMDRASERAARITELEAEVAREREAFAKALALRPTSEELDQARADLATLRAAVDEAVRRADNPSRYAECFSFEAAKYITEPLRNLTKPEAPSERIMSDKDRENPVEGAHPTQPEPEDALVELQDCPPGLFCFNGTLGFKSEYTTTLENPRRYQCDAYVVESGEYFHGGAKSTADRAKLMVRPIEIDQLALASRGLVRGEGVER